VALFYPDCVLHAGPYRWLRGFQIWNLKSAI